MGTNFDLLVEEYGVGFTPELVENFRGHIKALGFDEDTSLEKLRELHKEWWEMVKVDDED